MATRLDQSGQISNYPELDCSAVGQSTRIKPISQVSLSSSSFLVTYATSTLYSPGHVRVREDRHDNDTCLIYVQPILFESERNGLFSPP